MHSLTESIKARGYCAKLPEDKRLDIEQLLWSSCYHPREKRAGTGFPSCCPGRFMFYNTRAATGPAYLLQKLRTSFCAHTYRHLQTCKVSQGLTKVIWLDTEVRRRIRKAKTLLCSNSRHASVPASLLSVQQWLWSAVAYTLRRKSLGFQGKAMLKSPVGVHSTCASHPSMICFQGILLKCLGYQLWSQKSYALSQYCRY